MSATSSSPSISEHEAEQLERANASGRTPVVFVHGLWLLPTSWDRWSPVFEEAGYSAVTPGLARRSGDGRGGERATPRSSRTRASGRSPTTSRTSFAGRNTKPAVIGHSFGGLLTQIIAGRGLSAVSVAIDPAPFRGVLPLPISALSVGVAGARQPGQPPPRRPAHVRAVPLRLRERRRRGRGEGAVRDVRRAGLRRAALPGRDGEPEPLDGGQGRHQESRSRAAADHLGEQDHTVPPAIANA